MQEEQARRLAALALAACAAALPTGAQMTEDAARHAAQEVRVLVTEGTAVIGDPALTAAPSRGAGDRCRWVFAPAPNAVIGADGDRGRNVGVRATYEPEAAVVTDAGDGVHVDRRSRPQDDKR